MLPFSESTEMVDCHMSMRSPGEVIHFLTLDSNYMLDFKDRSPRRSSLHPKCCVRSPCRSGEYSADGICVRSMPSERALAIT